MSDRKPVVLFILISNLCISNCIIGILWTSISENVAFCARLCEEDSRCISFGYQARTKTCQGQSNKEYNPIYGSTVSGVFNFLLYGNKFDIKTVLASSCYNRSAEPLDPMVAIDGDTNTVFGTDIYASGFPYLIAEWTIPTFVTEILVYKSQVNAFRFQNVFVWIGKDNQTMELCNFFPDSNNNTMHRFVCVYPIKGNRMKIQHKGPEADTSVPLAGFAFRMLEIAEIYLYGFQ